MTLESAPIICMYTCLLISNNALSSLHATMRGARSHAEDYVTSLDEQND